MRRPRWQVETNGAADALEAMLPDSRPAHAKRRRPCGRSKFDRCMSELAVLRASGDWLTATPEHVVALYAWLHTNIYGADPLDLFQGDALVGASSACRKLLKDEFKGDTKALVRFVAWCWSRERNRPCTRRITWRLQFVSRALLVDYRVASVGGDL